MENSRPLRPGDVVEVRSASEILATLDENASLDGMPFMPEMLKHVGKRFTIPRRVEKICNNADPKQGAARRMRGTVHLDDLRCDGSAHGGCQYGCRLYWREEWLRPVGDTASTNGEDGAALDRLERLSLAGTMRPETETYRCQGTEAVAASERLRKYDVRQYARELSSRNVRPARLVWVLARTAWFSALRALRLRGWLPFELPAEGQTSGGDSTGTGLQTGDLVRVRSREEIAATLNAKGRNRGLSFSIEMVPYCGKTFRVRGRVERLIDETNGKMITIQNDCVILEGAVCTGVDGCWAYLFCPRGSYPFWREAWLERVEDPDIAAPSSANDLNRPATRSVVEPASPEVSAPLARIGRSRGT